MNGTSEINKTGEDLCERYKGAMKSLDRATHEVRVRENELENAREAFGKFMVPKDAKRGESFSIWRGNALVTVKVLENGKFDITERQR